MPTTHPNGQTTGLTGAEGSRGTPATTEELDMGVERYARTKEQRKKAKGGRQVIPASFKEICSSSSSRNSQSMNNSLLWELKVDIVR